VSVATLRLSNPESLVILATDQESLLSMRLQEDILLDEVDEIMEIQTPPGSYAFKSRFVKTSLGFIISGSFVFLDSDTSIRKRIDFELIDKSTIGVVRNHNRIKYNEQCWEGDNEVIHKMNWTVSSENYFNTGVIFYSGDTASIKFSELWHKYWL
jgi:hypothetical protein